MICRAFSGVECSGAGVVQAASTKALDWMAPTGFLAGTKLERWGFRCYMWITAEVAARQVWQAYRVAPQILVEPAFKRGAWAAVIFRRGE